MDTLACPRWSQVDAVFVSSTRARPWTFSRTTLSQTATVRNEKDDWVLRLAFDFDDCTPRTGGGAKNVVQHRELNGAAGAGFWRGGPPLAREWCAWTAALRPIWRPTTPLL